MSGQQCRQADRASADNRDYSSSAPPCRSVHHIRIRSAGCRSASPGFFVHTVRNWIEAGVSMRRCGHIRPGCRRSRCRVSSRRSCNANTCRGGNIRICHMTEMQETRTLSPWLECGDFCPDQSIIPTPSWPRIRPGAHVATSPFKMCKSVPQWSSSPSSRSRRRAP